MKYDLSTGSELRCGAKYGRRHGPSPLSFIGKKNNFCGSVDGIIISNSYQQQLTRQAPERIYFFTMSLEEKLDKIRSPKLQSQQQVNMDYSLGCR
jgi:hypothetical protein